MFRSLAFVLTLMATVTMASPYDTAVVNDHPVLFLRMNAPFGSASESDLSGGGHSGSYLPGGSRPQKTTMPNGDVATVFNGSNEYLEVPSARVFSVRRGGALTIEAWIRPDTLEFPYDEGDGYVYWAGKGEAGQHEYACRMYSRTNSASRPNRISGYVYNLSGGLGSGSYFQDPVTVGAWIHVAIVVSTRIRPAVIRIYKNGVLRDTTPLSQFDVVPRPGNAPVRIGARDLHSFFKGAIGKFAIYAYPLTEAQLKAHVLRMQ